MSNLILKGAKRILALFPPTWPFKAYNTLIKVPLLKEAIGLIVRVLTPSELNIPEGKIIFDRKDPVMAGAISLGDYEPEMMRFFRSSIKEGMTVIDIGANLGFFTIIAAKKVGPSGSVFSYEPDPHNFSLLEKNIAVNRFENAKALLLGLSDTTGTRKLFFGENNTTHSFGDKKGEGKSEMVPTDTLDHSLKTLGVKKVDLIKMDIEGAEPIALEGMIETLAGNPELTMIFEFHPKAIKRLGNSPLKFLERLRELGFYLSEINEDKKEISSIHNLVQFEESFGQKELSKNLIGRRC